MAVRLAWGIAVGTAAGGAACTSADGRPPLARITLEPEAILANDEFQTPVTLDGTRSADSVDDPEGTGPLTYAWTIEGDEYRLEAGSSETASTLVVRFRGDRPATVRLTVGDQDGLDAFAVARVRLTIR
jgi:hypothetical protein